jgi:hypothetical protein
MFVFSIEWHRNNGRFHTEPLVRATRVAGLAKLLAAHRIRAVTLRTHPTEGDVAGVAASAAHRLLCPKCRTVTRAVLVILTHTIPTVPLRL